MAEKKPAEYRIAKYNCSYVRDGSYQVPAHLMSSRNDVAGLSRHLLAVLPVEHVAVIAIDKGCRVIGLNVVEGAMNQCALYPSNVFRFLLCAGAAAFFLAHNHPGGTLEPSQADWHITKTLKDAGSLLEIPLMDHLIVADEKCVSMRDSTRW